MEAGMHHNPRTLAAQDDPSEIAHQQGVLCPPPLVIQPPFPLLAFPSASTRHWETENRMVWNQQQHTAKNHEFVYEISLGLRSSGVMVFFVVCGRSAW